MIEFLNYISLPFTLFGIMAISAMGLQLIVGGAGMLTLGHAAFFAIGGYSSAVFTTLIAPSFGITNPFFLCVIGVLAAILCTLFAASVVVIPCLRLKGDYLAIATLGFGQIVQTIFYNTSAVGGASGFSGIPHLTNGYAVWISVFLVGIFLTRFYKTHIGHAILFVREDELAARCFSISPEKSKAIAFLVGSCIAGIAGFFYAHTLELISPTAADFQKSVEILLAVVIGGRFSIVASGLGAGLLVLMPEFLRFLPLLCQPFLDDLLAKDMLSVQTVEILSRLMNSSMLIFSLIVILMMRFHGDGLLSLFSKGGRRVPSSC